MYDSAPSVWRGHWILGLITSIPAFLGSMLSQWRNLAQFSGGQGTQHLHLGGEKIYLALFIFLYIMNRVLTSLGGHRE